MNKTLFTILILVALIGGGFYWYSTQSSSSRCGGFGTTKCSPSFTQDNLVPPALPE